MQAFKVGCSVKIEDIGPLAICLEVAVKKIRLVLDGEEFWISKKLCKVA